jgi:hypothetical protein
MAMRNHRQTNVNSGLRHLRNHTCLKLEFKFMCSHGNQIQHDIKDISFMYQKSPYFSLILLIETIPIYQFSFTTARPVHEYELW